MIEQIKKRYENSIELNALNSLIKCGDFKLKFMELLDKVPTVITVFPLLIATSKDTREKLFEQKEKLEILDEEEHIEKFDFSEKIAKRGFNLQQKEKYYIFFEKIGLKRLFEEIIEKSVYDYIVGVLVGLDSNARKNRSGSFFEKMCLEIIEPICKDYGIELITQNGFKNLEEKFNIKINKELYHKKPDFTLVKDNKFLNIEVNFYNSSGSKPLEIVESYINRKNDLRNINVDFILISDGPFWQKTHEENVEKAFDNISIMNYKTAKSGELRKKIKEIFNIQDNN